MPMRREKTAWREKKKNICISLVSCCAAITPVTFLQSVGRTRVSCGTALKRVCTRQANLHHNTDTQPTERKQNVSKVQQETTLTMLARKQSAFLCATSSSVLAWSTCFELVASKAN